MGVNEAGPAMFFAGLILLIPHRIGMSRVNYIIKRYNLPISRAGLLLYKFHNPIEVSLTIGNISGFVITLIFICMQDSHYGSTANKTRMYVINAFMIVFLIFMFFSSIYMYRVYVSGDDFGYLDDFYFSLILITFFNGFTNPFAFAINGKNASFYALGIPTSGALVSILHKCYEYYSFKNGLDDFDYHVLRIQLFINIITILITLILHASLPWFFCETFHIGNAVGFMDFSPIAMLAFSLGTVYAFYPSIAPYSIIDYQYASVIELWILIISAIPTVLMAILDFTSDNLVMTGCQSGPNATPQKGPSGIRVNESKFNNWNPDNSGHWWWHCVWLCAIPYILCIQIFMSMLHYPHCLLSSFFNNPHLIGFISVLFNTLRETMQACGFAGAGKQNYSTNNDLTNTKVNGYIAPSNKLITLFVMMFCVFTGDGYLQHYRRCCRDCWPTTGYTRGQSFRYWLCYGFKSGSKSFRTAFTISIKTQIISYASCGWLIKWLFCFYHIIAHFILL